MKGGSFCVSQFPSQMEMFSFHVSIDVGSRAGPRPTRLSSHLGHVCRKLDFHRIGQQNRSLLGVAPRTSFFLFSESGKCKNSFFFFAGSRNCLNGNLLIDAFLLLWKLTDCFFFAFLAQNAWICYPPLFAVSASFAKYTQRSTSRAQYFSDPKDGSMVGLPF